MFEIDRQVTGPHLSSKTEVSAMNGLLSRSIAVNDGRVFWPGLVEISESLTEFEFKQHILWSPQLLALGREGFENFKVITTSDAGLQILQRRNLSPVASENIREVIDFQRGLVGNLGIVFPFDEFSPFWNKMLIEFKFNDGIQLIDLKDLELMLLQAEIGNKPPRFSSETFVKVNPILKDTKVMMLGLASLSNPEKLNDLVIVAGGRLEKGKFVRLLSEKYWYRQKKKAIAG